MCHFVRLFLPAPAPLSLASAMGVPERLSKNLLDFLAI